MFRNEVFEARKNKLHGDVFIAQPVSFAVITVIISSILVLAFTILFTGSYARSEQVSGYLVPSKGLVKIQAQQYGTLSELLVTEGDQVVSGQVMAGIRLSQHSMDGQLLADKGLIAQEQQLTAITTQISLEQSRFENEIAKLVTERTKLDQSMTLLSQQAEYLTQITASAKAAYQDVQGILEQGYISRDESERRRQSWLQYKSQENLKEQELTDIRGRKEQLEISLKQLPIEKEQRLAQLKEKQALLTAQMTDQEAKKGYRISSPVNGRVVSIHSGGVGRSVNVGQPLLTILPEGSHLEAELFVPSRAAGFVRDGQEVELLYDAFPHQRFGSFPAQISTVSETILAPEEVFAPFEIREPVYRVTASISGQHIPIRERAIMLQSGMTLNANIIIERRSFFEWLTEPLRAMGGSK